MMEEIRNENKEKNSRQNAIGCFDGRYVGNNGIACDEVGEGSGKSTGEDEDYGIALDKGASAYDQL